MGYRASRLYSWREVQELARELQSMHRASHVDLKAYKHHQREVVDQSMSTSIADEDKLYEASQSRIVRVERLKAEQALKMLERPGNDKAPKRYTPTHSFNPQAFKAAWRAGQQEANHHSSLHEVSVLSTNQSEVPDLTPTQMIAPHSAQVQGIDKAFNERVATPPTTSQDPTRHRASGQPPSPWELLRDHFIEQHRLYKAQHEHRETDES